jgi:hypothetical protein
MSIRIPSLDDRTYEQLVDVLRRQIPADEWTDHNASDPGITLLEALCWLGEMALYRMNRVPDSHHAKFLNFLIDPPEPVTIEVRLEATFEVPTPTPPVPATSSLTIPAGTLLATDFAAGRRFVFETFRPLELTPPPPPADPIAQGSVRGRAILEVFDETLGVSDGTAHQVFTLRPPRQALGIADPDMPAPVVRDFVNNTDTYEPNPRITVGGIAWQPVPSLRVEGSRNDDPLAPTEHYMVEAHGNGIRFGDDVFGVIPAAGADIACERYAVLDGPAALAVRAGDIRHVLNFTPPTDVTLQIIGNADAEGGANFFPLSRRFEQGLARFRAPYRLVTERDFETAVLEEFNAFQRLAGSTEEILRASVVVNRRPQPLTSGGETLAVAPANVTLLLLSKAGFDEAVFQDETVAAAAKQALVTVPDELWQRLRRFLDPRRLITTRLNRYTPQLRPVTISATAVVHGDRNVADMRAALRRRVYDFLSLVRGDTDGRGWRLGRSVYRSQLFRLLEDTDGVDHVAALTLSPANAFGNVDIGLHELPLLQQLTLSVVRG